MSNTTKVFLSTNGNSPFIELWSDSTAATSVIGYDPTNSRFSFSSGNSISNSVFSYAESTAAFHTLVNMQSNRLINLPVPTSDGEATTKSYVDAEVAASSTVKDPVVAASTVDLSANPSLIAVVYNATGGVSGRGQFTAQITGGPAFFLDNYGLNTNDRILLKD